MKRASLIVMVAMMAVAANGETLREHYHPPRMASELHKEPKVRQASTTVNDINSALSGQDPILGRSLASVFITDIINIVTNPGTTSWTALLFDLFNFLFMPIVGGVMMASTSYQYDQDPITYHNAEITKADMYASEMKLVKTTLYKAIGKPDFFGTEEVYVPPMEASFLDI